VDRAERLRYAPADGRDDGDDRATLTLPTLVAEAELAARRLDQRFASERVERRRARIADLEVRLRSADDVFGAAHLVVQALSVDVPLRWVEVGPADAPLAVIRLEADGDDRSVELAEAPLVHVRGALRLGLLRPLGDDERRTVEEAAGTLGRVLENLEWRALASQRRARQAALSRATSGSYGRPDEALRALTRAVLDAFGATAVVLYRVDGRSVAPVERAGEVTVEAVDGVAAQALATARPIIDPTGSFLASEPVPGMVGGLAAPVPGGSAAAGALSVLFAERVALSEEDSTDLAAFAQLAATTMERALLEHELERRELLRAGFVAIAETLSGPRETTETFAAVAAAAARALRASAAVVAVGDGDLRAVGVTPVAPALVDAGGAAGSLLALAAGEGRIVLCADVATDHRIPEAERAQLVGAGQRSALCLPIGSRAFGGETAAVLGVVWETPHTAADDDLELARHLAAAAAAAIERAEVLDAARRGRARAQDLQRISDLMSANLDAPAVLREVVAQAASLLDADASALHLVEGERLAVRAVHGPLTNVPDGDPARLSVGPVAEVLARRTPLAIREMRHDERVAGDDPLVSAGFSSFLGAPIVSADGGVRGVLALYGQAPRDWKADEVGALDTFAASATVALQNALLYQRVAQEKEKSEAMIASIADGIVVVDAEGRVEMWNIAAARMTGVDARTALHRPLRDVLRTELADVGDAAGRALDDAELGGGAVEVRLVRADREIWLSVRAARLRDPVEDRVGTVYALRDVSEERQLDQLKSDFVATVSHELRTPLTSIYGFAETLLRSEGAFSSEDRETFLSYIASEAERLTRLVDGLLSVARLEAGGVALDLVDVDVAEVLEEIVHREAGRVRTTHRLALALGDAPLIAAADRDKLRQIILNLVDNAIKYSPGGGTVEVSAERRLDAVEIRVRDEGIGISIGDQRNLFRKFFRADARMTRGIRGIGLGLYLTRGFVTAMGGRIRVESTEGVGSTFIVELPLRRAADQGVQAA
jgi:two-component system phosphate regulon sensor histidine kinase PhoR